MAASLKLLRLWHMLIAILAIAAYLTDEVEPLHQWLGYSIVVMIGLRLFMALSGSGPLGLQRFYPHFHDLKLGSVATHPAISRTLLLGIAVSFIGVTTTGILMDRGRALQAAPWSVSGDDRTDGSGGKDYGLRPATQEYPDGEDEDEGQGKEGRGEDGSDEDGEEGALGEIHELFANLLLGIVAMHVGYLVLFKWPLARFMLFLGSARAKT